jgi:cAMP-dependent protein kinase regulator
VARRQELIDHLKQVPLFSRCTGRELRIVARHAEPVRLPEGSVLFREGDTGDAFFVVLDGTADVRKGKADRRVNSLGPGAYFGEMALLDAAPRSATIVAASELELAVLGARIFRTLLRELPTISERMLAALAGELREARRDQDVATG